MLNYLLSLSPRDDIKIEVDPSRLRPVDADLQIPNIEKFTSHTGLSPEITFQQTMKDLLGYWRNKIKNGRIYLTR